MGSSIRKARSEDTEVLAETIRTSFRDVADRFGLTLENCPRHPSNCTKDWIRHALDQGITYFILEHEGAAAGCAALEHAGEGICYLERLAVLPRHRGQGSGRDLVSRVLSEAQSLGARQVDIGIIADHTELKEWYKKLGFVEGESKVFPHLPFRVLFMTRALD
jgi:diamine N-acetyltransferase